MLGLLAACSAIPICTGNGKPYGDFVELLRFVMITSQPWVNIIRVA